MRGNQNRFYLESDFLFQRAGLIFARAKIFGSESEKCFKVRLVFLEPNFFGSESENFLKARLVFLEPKFFGSESKNFVPGPDLTLQEPIFLVQNQFFFGGNRSSAHLRNKTKEMKTNYVLHC